MRDLPNNLHPLVYRSNGWPLEEPLDVEQVRTAIWLCNGNVTEAAARIGSTSVRVRALIKKSPYLQRELSEAYEQTVDDAEQAIREGMKDADTRLETAKFVLKNSSLARQRGWGTNNSVNVNSQGGPVVIQWGDGTKFGVKQDSAGEVVDVTPIEGPANE